ncbi:hypothetical protein [Sporosarcina sp. FSL K6-1508]|uniref:hypothetical protein n=1 Tax=Sporosarcina sp. FSL K6-1508 TaxID=2921553 RepID=UPI0030F93BD3
MNSYLDIENKVLEYERLNKLYLNEVSSSLPFFHEERIKLHDEKKLLLSEIHQQYKYLKTDMEQNFEPSKHIRDFISSTGVENIIHSVVSKSEKINSEFY